MEPFNKYLLYLYYNLKTMLVVGNSKTSKTYEIHSLIVRKKVVMIGDDDLK